MALRFLNSGYFAGSVGIGTESPDRKLHVKDSAIVVSEFEGTNTGSLMDLVNSNSSQLYNGIRFTQGTTSKMAITHIADGTTKGYIQIGNSWATGSEILVVDGRTSNVGIGDTTPTSKLTILGTSTAASNTPSDAIVDIHGTSTAHLLMGVANVSPYGAWINTDATGQPLVLQGVGGNVGIGVTDPEKRLEVKSDTTYDGIMLDVLSAPEITFRDRGNSDTRVGTGRHALDGFHIDTYSGNAVLIKGSNRFVGIGTTGPTAKLHVLGGSNDTIDETTANFKVQGGGGNGTMFGTIASSPFTSYIQSAYVVDTSLAQYNLALNPIGGNVGIGTTGPLTKLHIAGATDANIIRIENTSTSLSLGSTIGAIQFFNNDPTDYSPNVAASIYATAGASGGSGSLRFKTTEPGVEGDPATDTMIITNGGNVGIGTTSPDTLLHLKSSGPKIKLQDTGNWGSNATGGVEFYDQNSLMAFSEINSAGDYLNYLVEAGNMTFGTSNTERMRILANGNVGIGLTNPGQKLEVTGNIKAHDGYIRSEDGATGDYIEIFNDGANTGQSFITTSSTELVLIPQNGGLQVKGQNYGTGNDASLQIYNALNAAVKVKLNSNGDSYLNGGNVGIGATLPTEKLHVEGRIRLGSTPVICSHDNIGIDIDQNNNSGINYFRVTRDGELTELFRVQENGNVGIGTTTPGAKLDVNGIIFAGDGDKATPGYSFASDPDTGMFRDSANVLVLGVNGDTRIKISNTDIVTYKPLAVNTTSITSGVALDVGGVGLIGDSGVGDFYLGNYATANHFRFHTNNSNTYFDMNCGDIYWRQGTSTRYQFFASTANMTIQGTLTQNSDARTKENVIEISDCISKVKAMRGVYYNRTDFNTEVTKVGVIAQEVEAVLPELVLESPETGLKSVAYSELTSVLINAIKEQQEIIEDLKTRITKLEN